MIMIIVIMQKVLPENRCFIDICVCSLGYVLVLPSETQKPANVSRLSERSRSNGTCYYSNLTAFPLKQRLIYGVNA